MSYYATLSHTNFLKSGMRFTFTAFLSLNLPYTFQVPEPCGQWLPYWTTQT